MAPLGGRAALADQVGDERPPAGSPRRTGAGGTARGSSANAIATGTARSGASVSLVTSPDQTRSHSASSSSSSVRASRTLVRSGPYRTSRPVAPAERGWLRAAPRPGGRPIRRRLPRRAARRVRDGRAPPCRHHGQSARDRSRRRHRLPRARRASEAGSRPPGRPGRRARGSRPGSDSPPAGSRPRAAGPFLPRGCRSPARPAGIGRAPRWAPAPPRGAAGPASGAAGIASPRGRRTRGPRRPPGTIPPPGCPPRPGLPGVRPRAQRRSPTVRRPTGVERERGCVLSAAEGCRGAARHRSGR